MIAVEEPMKVEQVSSIIFSFVSAPDFQPPSLSMRVFMDECMFCFHLPFFEGGIYVCFHHFMGFCANHVKKYSACNGCKYFLRIRKFKVPPKEVEEPKDKVQRLCILAGKELTENLWLNLSDIFILCGCAQYILEEKTSKGNGHAKIHAESAGFPVLVKLGTILNGDADVYSYVENESVCDPYLRKHLAHFDLDINKFEKTEKSALELELDLNQKCEWSRCQEDGVTLEDFFGSGFTGLINIGSSCYINSVIQTLLLDPAFIKAYTSQSKTQFPGPHLVELYDDFDFPLSRVVQSLICGNYAKDGFEHNGIKPTQFRCVAGRGYSEFSTVGQQGAIEYIVHLFKKIKETLNADPNSVVDFRFKTVVQFRYIASKRVRYVENEKYVLSLLIPEDKLIDKSEHDSAADSIGPLPKPPRQAIDLTTLIGNYTSTQLIHGFVSPIIIESKDAKQSYSLGTFPNFFLIQVNRYEYDDYNQPKTLGVDIGAPDELDLQGIRFADQKPDDKLLPEIVEVQNAKNERAAIKESYVRQIIDMNFPRQSAESAAQTTQNTSAKEAVEWLFDHVDDPILAQGPQPQAQSSLNEPNLQRQKDSRFKSLSENIKLHLSVRTT